MYKGKKYPLEKELIYFLEEFTYILLPLEKKSFYKKHKNVYFPNLLPETQLAKLNFLWILENFGKYVM